LFIPELFCKLLIALVSISQEDGIPVTPVIIDSNTGQARCDKNGRCHAQAALDTDENRFFHHFITTLTH